MRLCLRVNRPTAAELVVFSGENGNVYVLYFAAIKIKLTFLKTKTPPPKKWQKTSPNLGLGAPADPSCVPADGDTPPGPHSGALVSCPLSPGPGFTVGGARLPGAPRHFRPRPRGLSPRMPRSPLSSPLQTAAVLACADSRL